MNIAQYIDHTLLKPNATKEQVSELCTEAIDNGFAAVCINQNYIRLAKKELSASDVKVCTVVGFPLGAVPTEVKVLETKMSIESGADEIDMVINIAELKNGNTDYIYNDIKALAEICHNNKKTLKVIFETCLLTDEEIVIASKLSEKANADFIKTSTGFSTHGATLPHVQLMRKSAGTQVKIKASGGVRSLEDAKIMIEAGASRIGTSSGVKIINN